MAFLQRFSYDLVKDMNSNHRTFIHLETLPPNSGFFTRFKKLLTKKFKKLKAHFERKMQGVGVNMRLKNQR